MQSEMPIDAEERKIELGQILSHLLSSSRWREMLIGQVGPGVCEACLLCMGRLLHLLLSSKKEQSYDQLWNWIQPAVLINLKAARCCTHADVLYRLWKYSDRSAHLALPTPQVAHSATGSRMPTSPCNLPSP